MSQIPDNSETVGLIAGAGLLPQIIAGEAASQGYSVVIAGLKGFVSPDLENACRKFSFFKPGHLLSMIEFLKANNAREVLLCGHIDHRHVFKPQDLDPLMISILSQKDKRAESLLGKIADAIEENGLKVADQRDYLGRHLVSEDIFNNLKPSTENLKDLEFGWPLAKKITELNIGQSIMVKNGVIIAVEAVEGTDGMIRRSTDLGVQGCTVIKLPAPAKDPRFDLPVIGTETIESMKIAKAGLLAVASKQTIIIDPEECIQTAKEAEIAIVAKPLEWEPEE